MRMKIIKNTSQWDTKCLRAFIRCVLSWTQRMEGRRAPRMVFEIKTIRNARSSQYISGTAYHYLMPKITLRIPTVEIGIDKQRMAFVIYHEILHHMGKDHRTGNPSLCHDRNYNVYSFADNLELKPKEKKTKEKVDVRQARYSRVLKMVSLWERKLKTARTKVKAYTAKQKYYEKIFEKAAMSPPRPMDSDEEPIEELSDAEYNGL